MDTTSEARAWAQQTFGHVAFPDRRKVELVVRLAAGLAERPFAQVSKAFSDAPMRQAVYDLLAPALGAANVDVEVTLTALAYRAWPQFGAESLR